LHAREATRAARTFAVLTRDHLEIVDRPALPAGRVQWRINLARSRSSAAVKPTDSGPTISSWRSWQSP
jgi:hypothetical protein